VREALRRALTLSGSGLGPAIVRRAEASGGSVEARNAPGGRALLRVSFGMPPDLIALASLEA
jgi:signal transduction histidine kinase